jgi:NADH-quinone oxidoreductase subunit C
VPDGPGLELLAKDLESAVPDSVRETSYYREQASIHVDGEKLIDVLRWLRDTPGQEYTFLASLHGCDYLPAEPRFGVHYELLNRDRVERLRVKVVLDDPGDAALPELESCVSLFPTAEFQEREVYDFFGVVFRGHPDLRRILMPEVYEGFPQRRDFPLGGEPVLFTHNEPRTPAWFE